MTKRRKTVGVILNNGVRVPDYEENFSVIKDNGDTVLIEVEESYEKRIEELENKTTEISQTEFRAVMNFARKLIPIHELSQEELDQMINVYPKWEFMKDGDTMKEGIPFQYEGNLFEVVEGKGGHKKQSDWLPDEQPSLYNKIVPEGVIGDWEQRGGHNAYKIGEKVISSQDGELYELIIAGWQGYEPPNQGWKKV